MREKKYILRCMAYRKKTAFVGVCLDLSLYAEGATVDDVRRQVESQVISYMSYALENGAERDLFPRRAPFRYWLTYYFIRTIGFVHLMNRTLFDVFFDPKGYRRTPLFGEIPSA